MIEKSNYLEVCSDQIMFDVVFSCVLIEEHLQKQHEVVVFYDGDDALGLVSQNDVSFVVFSSLHHSLNSSKKNFETVTVYKRAKLCKKREKEFSFTDELQSDKSAIESTAKMNRPIC